MDIFISSIGLTTAQGSAGSISRGAALLAPEQWPWPVNGWATSHSCRPALGIRSSLTGIARWRALTQLALQDCFSNESPSPQTPIFIGSCNGSAGDFDVDRWTDAFNSAALLEGTAWAGQRLPVFSSSCNSGLHALYAARQVLLSGRANEAVVLAVDILSRSNQENFEGLRVLSDSPMPWQPTNAGFVLGEAAVALRLVRDAAGVAAPRLKGLVLANELTRAGGLQQVLKSLALHRPDFLLGQGTGPFANDESELAAFQQFVAGDVPLATPLVNFGHTLGASGLLAVALAALILRTPQAISTLEMPAANACDGRPLKLQRNAKEIDDVVVSCRALNGSCAAARVGTEPSHVQDGKQDQSEKAWYDSAPTGPLMNALLRRLAAEAPRHRPVEPPDVVLVRLQEPLAPPPEARIGERLLPSAVLEMTPGFVSQLIARRWGFAGPALCTVGDSREDAAWNLSAAVEDLGLIMAQIDLSGTGDTGEIGWDH